MVYRNIQYVPASVVQEIMGVLGSVIEYCLGYFFFVLYPNNTLFIYCKLEDFCSFLRYDFLSSMRASDFGQGQTGPEGSYFHSFIYLFICLSVHLSTCA